MHISGLEEGTVSAPASGRHDTSTARAPARAFSLKPLMFETFVCTMALLSFMALAGPIARIVGMPAWQIGTVVTVAGVAWMLMARVWGRLSDRHGRRPIILLGVAGFAISFVAMAGFVELAIEWAIAPWVVFAGLLVTRGTAGIFYAAVPATSAALVADHIPPDRRPKAMAALGAASAMGFVIGPACAGLLAEHGLALPLFLIGILPVAGLVVLWRVLPRVEHHAPPNPSPLSPFDKRLRRPAISMLLGMSTTSSAQVLVGFYAIDRLALMPEAGARVAGIALGCVGAALIPAQILMQRLDWTASRLIRLGMVLGAIGFASVMFITSPMGLYAGYAIAAFGMGWVFPSVMAQATSSVGPHEQGAAAGTVSAAQGMGIVIGPMIGTAVYALDPRAPFGVMGLLLLAGALWNLREPRIANHSTMTPDLAANDAPQGIG